MGMDISSKLIVGLEYSELIEGLEEDQIERINEMLDNGELDIASPSYDSPRKDWIVGCEVCAWGGSPDLIRSDIRYREDDFHALGFNKEPNVYCTQHVY